MSKCLRAAALLLLLCLLAVPAWADAQEETPEILILHESNPAGETLDSLRQLADLATAMGKRANLATPEQVPDYRGYTLILCYDLRSDEVLAEALTRSRARLVFLGGELLPECLERAGTESVPEAASRRGIHGVLRFSAQGETQEQIVLLPPSVYSPDAAEQSGQIEAEGLTLPFWSQWEKIAYVPLTDFRTALPLAALEERLGSWLGWAKDTGRYLILEDVYAYMPAQTLLDRVEALKDSGLPFAVSVMPVYQNGDYPAMARFCQVLRYAQDCGGTILLHAPIQRQGSPDFEALDGSMAQTMENLARWGVYPAALEVPYSYLWDRQALDWLACTGTAFVYEDSAAPGFYAETVENLAAFCGNTWILPGPSLDGQGGARITRLSAASALEELRAELNQAAAFRWSDLRDADQYLRLGDHTVQLRGGVLTYSGTGESSEESWAVPEDFDYQRNVLKRVTINIQQESRFLIIMVAVVTVLFLGMILYARVRQYRHFLYYSRQQEYDGSAESLARQAAAWGRHKPAHLKHRKKKGED